MEFNDQIGIYALSMDEMKHIDGGGLIPKWLKGISVAYIASEIIDHWDDIKEGLSEGWSAATGS